MLLTAARKCCKLSHYRCTVCEGFKKGLKYVNLYFRTREFTRKISCCLVLNQDPVPQGPTELFSLRSSKLIKTTAYLGCLHISH